jgi:hypothetical protein
MGWSTANLHPCVLLLGGGSSSLGEEDRRRVSATRAHSKI